MGENLFENEYTKMWIEEGILFITYTPDIKVTLEIAQRCVKERIIFSKGIAYPVLADTRTIKAVDKNARTYLSSPEASAHIKAGAFITNSLFQKVFMNFFVMVNKPIAPAKLFTIKEEALIWLYKFK